MLGVLRSAQAGPRGAAARVALAALLACVGLTWTAGASDALATYGTVTIKKVNQGGDQTDRFRFTSSTAIAQAGELWVTSGGEYTTRTVHANAGRYDAAPYYVTEDASANYELKDISCSVAAAPYKAKVGSASTTLAQRKAAIKVGVGEKVTCVFTNERKTARITVKKELRPIDDAGRFGLQVDGQTVKALAGDGDSGSVYVPTGSHKVGETGPNLDDYVRSVTCTKPGGAVVAEGAGPVDVAVARYDDITCVVKNVRKAKIVVEKHTAPAGAATAFDFTVSPGAIGFPLTDGGSKATSVEAGRTYSVTEADPHAKGYKLSALQCTSGGTDVATRTATVTPTPGETVTCSFTNAKLQPGIHVVKTGPAFAYSGDTLDFGFDVSNTGERPLHGIEVADDKCSPVAGPVSKAGGNDDDVLDPGETWHYTCSYAATHAIADPNPVVNTVTAQGRDDEDTKVEDQDAHETRFLHPAIDIEKTGPATATAGARLTYTLDVTNPGDVSLGGVSVTDARCLAAPVRTSVNGDETPDTLEPGDHWAYTCQVQTQAGQTQVVNVADVRGTDEHERTVTGEDTLTTRLSVPPSTPVTTTTATPAAPAVVPAQQVAGTQQTARRRAGTAALGGPRACPTTRAVTATVTGREIRRVTFLVGGKAVKTVTKADSRGRWTLTLRTTSLRRGVNSVVARVQFTTASQTRARTLRISITRCAARQVRPHFTG